MITKIIMDDLNSEMVGRTFSAQFETSYGSYHLEDTQSKLDSVEIDIEYPRGIYNSNTAGDFTDRSIDLEYNLIGNVESGWLNLSGASPTETEKTNTPQRRTYKLPKPAGLDRDPQWPSRILSRRYRLPFQ